MIVENVNGIWNKSSTWEQLWVGDFIRWLFPTGENDWSWGCWDFWVVSPELMLREELQCHLAAQSRAEFPLGALLLPAPLKLQQHLLGTQTLYKRHLCLDWRAPACSQWMLQIQIWQKNWEISFRTTQQSVLELQNWTYFMLICTLNTSQNRKKRYFDSFTALLKCFLKKLSFQSMWERSLARLSSLHIPDFLPWYCQGLFLQKWKCHCTGWQVSQWWELWNLGQQRLGSNRDSCAPLWREEAIKSFAKKDNWKFSSVQFDWKEEHFIFLYKLLA